MKKIIITMTLVACFLVVPSAHLNAQTINPSAEELNAQILDAQKALIPLLEKKVELLQTQLQLTMLDRIVDIAKEIVVLIQKEVNAIS